MDSDPDISSDESALPESHVDKPVLASEALMEDLAPEEPWRAGARWWSLLAGVLLLSGAVPVWMVEQGSPPMEAIPSLATGGVAVLAALLPIPYLWRGLVMLAVGGTTVGLAFAQLGPAAFFEPVTGHWWLAHMAAAFTLPAALLFRERYRALPRARWFLGISQLVTLTFVAYCVLTIAGGTLLAQIVSGVAIAAVVLSFLGFMGSHATIAGSLLSGFVIAGVTAQLGVVLFSAGSISGPMASLGPLSAIGGFLGFSLLGSLGLAQVLAAASFAHARSIDFRREPTERPQMPSLTSDSWTGRR
jgi:hypothetical protein